MRPVGFQVLVLAALSSALPMACASLLGDFSNGATGSDSGEPEKEGSTALPDSANPGAEGGGVEAGAQDAPSGSDGSQSGGGDASDAATGFAQLTCQIPPTQNPQHLGTIQINSNNYGPRLFNTTVGNQTQFRFAVQEQPQNGPGTYHVYNFGQGNNGNGVDTPTPQSSVQALVRYATGIGALMSVNVQVGNDNYNVLEVSTLEDTASTWTTPVPITSNTELATDCGTNNYNLRGALLVNNAATQNYTAVWSCNSNVTNPPANILRAVMYSGGQGTPVSWPAPPLDDGGGAADGLGIVGMVANAQNLYVVANANGDGPSAGSAPTIYTAGTASQTTFGAPTTYTVPLTNPTDFLQVFGFQGTNAGEVGFAGLEANLTTPTLIPDLYVGSVPPTKMASLVPSTDLGATSLPNISSVPIINGGGGHWESFLTPPASDNLLAAGPIDPDSNGLNFIWLNGRGQVISQRLDTNAFFYYSTADGGTGTPIYGGDVTFTGAPGATYAGLEIVYLVPGELPDGGGNGVAIWATQAVCTQ